MAPTIRQDRHDQASGGRDKRDDTNSRPVRSSHIITERIEVGVPAQVAFDQWTQFDKWSEMFKRESADANGSGSRRRGVGQEKVQVRSQVGPSSRQWTAEIVEVAPGRRIKWRAKGPFQAMGATSFHSLDDRLTLLMVEIEYHPDGFFETVGNFFRMQRRRVRRDLRLFKHYVEMRGEATGSGPKRARGDGLRETVDQGDGS